MDCRFCKLLQDVRSSPTFIAEFPNSVALLNHEQTYYRGRSLLILKSHHDHLHLVPQELQQAVMPEMSALTTAILKAFGGFRANHESLGNQVSHVHWHITPRHHGDTNAGGPPFHTLDFEELVDDEYRQVAAEIRTAM